MQTVQWTQHINRDTPDPHPDYYLLQVVTPCKKNQRNKLFSNQEKRESDIVRALWLPCVSH